MVTGIHYEPVYEPVVGEEILFQPSNMKVVYVKELNNAENVLEHETPLYKDIIGLIMDFTVGTESYWKNQFTNGVIKELNSITFNGECPHFLYENYNTVWGHYMRSINFYTSKFEKIMKEKNIKTKKDILSYFIKHRLDIKYNNEFDRYSVSTRKELMRMKKSVMIRQYAHRMNEISNITIHNSTAHNEWLRKDCDETQRKNIMKDFMRRNLYEHYLLD